MSTKLPYTYSDQKIQRLYSQTSVRTIEQLCRTVLMRVRDRPYNYIDFGPYWFAVKQILQEQGFDLGSYSESSMVKRFRDPDDRATIVRGWICADERRGTYFHGSRDFQLDEYGDEIYLLHDPDMDF